MNHTDDPPASKESEQADRATPVSDGPVVVGVDWTLGAQAALHWSARLAGDMGAKVILAHAIRPVVANVMAIPPFDFDTYRDNVRREIDGWSDALGDVAHEKRLVEDDPASAVLAIADEVEAGLIVVGAHATGKWTPPLLGSVTSKILHKSDHPVAVVPVGAETQLSRQVVVGIDGSPQSERALRWAATSDVTDGRDLYAASVVPLTPYSAHPYFPDQPLFAEQPHVAISGGGDVAGHTAEAVRRLTELVARQTGARISADVLIGPPVERLVEAGENAFAIVLGTSGHGALAQAILGSTGRGVATHSRVPVIFVP